MARVIESGSEVKMTCYEEGCSGVAIVVTLGKGFDVDPDLITLGGIGRFSWESIKCVEAKGFELHPWLGGSGFYECPSCKTLLGGVIVISDSQGGIPTILGCKPPLALDHSMGY